MRLIVFIVLLVVLCTPFWWLARTVGFYAYTLLLMWCPAIAAMLALKVTGGSLSSLGWNPGRMRYLVGALLLVGVGYALLHAGLLAIGVIDFPDPDYLANRRGALGLGEAPAALVIGAYFLLVLLAGSANLAIGALGEELGWRGFLTPELNARFGFIGSSIGVGALWAAWHFPLLIGAVSTVQIALFSVMAVGLSFAYTWFRLASGSVWPAVILHAAHNAVMQSFFISFIVETGPQTSRWIDETGYGLALLGVAFAVIFSILSLKRRAV